MLGKQAFSLRDAGGGTAATLGAGWKACSPCWRRAAIDDASLQSREACSPSCTKRVGGYRPRMAAGAMPKVRHMARATRSVGSALPEI